MLAFDCFDDLHDIVIIHCTIIISQFHQADAKGTVIPYWSRCPWGRRGLSKNTSTYKKGNGNLSIKPHRFPFLFLTAGSSLRRRLYYLPAFSLGSSLSIKEPSALATCSFVSKSISLKASWCITCIGSACKKAFKLLAMLLLSVMKVFRVAGHQYTLNRLPSDTSYRYASRHHSLANVGACIAKSPARAPASCAKSFHLVVVIIL